MIKLKNKILDFLKNTEEAYISGQKMSEELGISRNAVWKHIKTLKEEGYGIESITNKGYRLVERADRLSEAEIKPLLNTHFIGQKIIYIDTIDSTNRYAKEIAESLPEGSLIIAEEQTAGRGRMNRKWQSPKQKGIWMSLILKPQLPSYRAPQITQVVAVALVKALEACGFQSQIKWPNDIIIHKKKVCGILTEMTGSIEQIQHIIIGIGINANLDEKDFELGLEDKGTSLRLVGNREVSRAHLLARVLQELEKYYFKFLVDDLDEITTALNEYSALLNQEAKLSIQGKSYVGKVLKINRDGSLEVEIEGKVQKIISGEVSIQGLYSYVD